MTTLIVAVIYLAFLTALLYIGRRLAKFRGR